MTTVSEINGITKISEIKIYNNLNEFVTNYECNNGVYELPERLIESINSVTSFFENIDDIFTWFKTTEKILQYTYNEEFPFIYKQTILYDDNGEVKVKLEIGVTEIINFTYIPGSGQLSFKPRPALSLSHTEFDLFLSTLIRAKDEIKKFNIF